VRIWSFRRATLGICAATMLAGCGGSPTAMGAYGTGVTTPAASGYRIYGFTGSKQSFKVPPSVTRVTVTAIGAGGAGSGSYSLYQPSGGKGAMVTATIPVTPGERLAIFVAGSGMRGGGFNGGGGSGYPYGYGSGGGASDVRQGGEKLANRVLVAPAVVELEATAIFAIVQRAATTVLPQAVTAVTAVVAQAAGRVVMNVAPVAAEGAAHRSPSAGQSTST
jgi:hypothetical protein